MNFETLIDRYLGCRANKRRSPDSVYYEMHWERDTRRLYDDFTNRVVQSLIYAFVSPRPRPREVIACQMQMKILQYHFDMYVRPLVEERLTDRTFNNRLGYGPDAAIDRFMDDIFEASRGYTRDCWIVSRDIKAYFPSTNLDRSYNNYRKLIEENIEDEELRDDLLYILLRVNYAYPQLHAVLRAPREKWNPIIAEGKSVIFNCELGRGACLGNQYWQVEKNYDICEFDHYQIDTCGFRYVRFVDDMRWVGEDKAALLKQVKESEVILRERFGYQMHPKKRSCQHFSKGGSFINTYYKFERVYVGNRVVRHADEVVRNWNRKVSVDNLQHFLASINSFLGLMKRRFAYGIIRNLVDEVSPKWKELCEFNDKRRCFEAKPGYGRNIIIGNKYNFKLQRNGKRHSVGNQRLGVAADRTPSGYGLLGRPRCQMHETQS